MWVYRFRSTCLIFGVELMALVAYQDDEAAEMAGCSLWSYMDSNNSLAAMTRGDSNTAAIAVLVGRAWELIRRVHIRTWFSRAPSKLSPADLPTRGGMLPFRSGAHRSFRTLPQLYRLRRAVARRKPHWAKSRAIRMRFRFPPPPVPLGRNIYHIRRNEA